MSFLSGCPTGVVFAFAGPTAPDGWLLCDGTPISRTVYAALFAAIGTAHGSGDGSTTFNLPDYRGRMLRGGDSFFGGSAANRDPDKASRTAMNAGGNTGNSVGSVQGQATAKNGLANSTSSVSGNTVANNSGLTNTDHTHNYSENYTQVNTGSFGITSAPPAIGILVSDRTLTSAGSNTSLNHQHSIPSLSLSGTAAAQTITGDNETRPINAYVNYIIKV